MPISAAAAGLVGAIGSAALNAASQARTNAVNRQQAEDAFRKQQAAVREMNEYNSPAQQIVRLKAAGLHPSLAYGADGAMVGNQSDVPAYNPIPSEAPSVGNLGSDIMNVARYSLEAREQMNRDNLAMAEMAVKDAQTFMMYTQGHMNEAATTEMLTLLGFKEQSYIDQHFLAEANFAKVEQEIKESESRIDLNDAEIKHLNSMVHLNDVSAYEIMSLLPAKLRNLDADTFMKRCAAGLYHAEIAEVADKIATLQYNRQLDAWHAKMEKARFDRESHQYKVEYGKWKAEMLHDIQERHSDRVTGVMRTVIGSSAYGIGQAAGHNETSTTTIETIEPPRTVVKGLGQ